MLQVSSVCCDVVLNINLTPVPIFHEVFWHCGILINRTCSLHNWPCYQEIEETEPLQNETNDTQAEQTINPKSSRMCEEQFEGLIFK
jgi:hypothetical protein